MRNVVCIFLLVVFFAAFKADAQNLVGEYSFSREVPVDKRKEWLAREERTLILNADSTFTYFIRYATSDFPGNYKGKWSIADKQVKLIDTDAAKELNKPIVILLDIKSETELTGKEKKEKFILVRKKE